MRFRVLVFAFPIAGVLTGCYESSVVGTNPGTLAAVDAGEAVLAVAAVRRLDEADRPAPEGATVRLVVGTGRQSRRITGRLDRVTSDSVFLQTAEGPEMVERSEVRGAAFDAGGEAKWAQGWAWGTTIGTGVALFDVVAARSRSRCLCYNYSPPATTTVVANSVLVGATAGAIIGALFPDTHWRGASNLRAPATSDALAVSVAPTFERSQRVGLAARLTF